MSSERDSSTSLAGLVAAARFFARLPLYLRNRVTLSEARSLLANRLHSRPQLFLDRLRYDVFGQPGGVYHQLFRHAGCELGDIEAAVSADGLEATLSRLYREGVYLTIDEFKGRKPVVRGTLHIDAGHTRLRSPRASYHMRGSSGGSRSQGTPVLIDLRFVRDCAANCSLYLNARGGSGWVKADWETPGAGARFRLVKFATFGERPAAWFTQIHPNHSSLPPVVKWNTRAIRWAGALAGRPFPAPVYAPLSDPAPVAHWLSHILREGRIPHLLTFPGSAVRLCLTAQQHGIDIAGTRLTLTGEPITQARIDTIRQTGCFPTPRYGTMECGAIGYGCQRPEQADDIHLLADMHAVIQAGAEGAAIGLPPGALLLTNLHAQSPFLMINLSLGDQAQLNHRDCGCPLQRLGWTTHLHSVRSFEKLTGGGVTFLGTDVIRILEEVLPTLFGGKPTDYQLVEQESRDGQPQLVLRVHPSLGELDEACLADTFLSQLAGASAPQAVMAQMWRDSNTLQIARRPPAVSRAGKILHLHTGTWRED